MTDEERLRSLLGERIPVGGAAEDTAFSDEEITDLLSQGNSLNAAAFLGWTIKAAEASSAVDFTESGSSRKLSSLFDHAQRMASFFWNIAKDESIAISGGIVGRTAKILRCVEEEITTTSTPFSGATEHVRFFPMYRMKAILG